MAKDFGGTNYVAALHERNRVHSLESDDNENERQCCGVFEIKKGLQVLAVTEIGSAVFL